MFSRLPDWNAQVVSRGDFGGRVVKVWAPLLMEQDENECRKATEIVKAKNHKWLCSFYTTVGSHPLRVRRPQVMI
jgi:hypothetical protein